MEISRSRIVEVLFVALLVLIGVAAVYRSDVFAVDELHPWDDPALAALRGAAAARQDLKGGLRRVAVFGLPVANAEPRTSTLSNFGYALTFGGCVVGGGGQYDYWSAYNRVMIEAGRVQFGERFAAEVATLF